MENVQPLSLTNPARRFRGSFSRRSRPLTLTLVAVAVITVPIGFATMAASGPAQLAKAGISFTVLDTRGWSIFSGAMAATSLPDLLALIREGHPGLQDACPSEGCLVGTVAPARALLIAFSPSNNSCNRVTKITVALSGPRELTITTDVTSACDDSHDGDGSRPPAPDLLLAVPLKELPSVGTLSILCPDSSYAGSGATTVFLG